MVAFISTNRKSNMEKTTNLMKSSDLYRKIDELRLSASDRREAINALVIAENLIDAIEYVLKAFRHAPNGLPTNAKASRRTSPQIQLKV